MAVRKLAFGIVATVAVSSFGVAGASFVGALGGLNQKIAASSKNPNAALEKLRAFAATVTAPFQALGTKVLEQAQSGLKTAYQRCSGKAFGAGLGQCLKAEGVKELTAVLKNNAGEFKAIAAKNIDPAAASAKNLASQGVAKGAELAKGGVDRLSTAAKSTIDRFAQKVGIPSEVTSLAKQGVDQLTSMAKQGIDKAQSFVQNTVGSAIDKGVKWIKSWF